NSGMEEVIVGVVGTLQFDVFQYRMKNEYGVDLRMEMLPYEEIRLIDSYPGELGDMNLGSDAELLEDYRGRSLLVFSSYWAIDFTCRKNPGLQLKEIVVAEGYYHTGRCFSSGPYLALGGINASFFASFSLVTFR